MNKISDLAKEQYTFVQESRTILFDYCKTIKPDDFINQNSSFGRGGSIRNLLVHIAYCYQQWIANRVLSKNLPSLDKQTYKNIEDVIKRFSVVDQFMIEFFEYIADSEKEIEFKKDGIMQHASPFKIFSHVITHEFHHKGQILSISRHLEYIPVDTDILR